MSEPQPKIAILGATGLVGRKMMELLEESSLPVGELRLLGSSSNTKKRTLTFRGSELPVQAASVDSLKGLDLVLSSAGGEISRRLLPLAAENGAICIDNTSAFRMDPDIPLVVPEVNGDRLDGMELGSGGGIIANPNCSTIQMVVALKPLHDAAEVQRVVVSTYQSVSGAGREELTRFGSALQAHLDGQTELGESLRGTAAFDVQPTIGELDVTGDTGEEKKMILETAKILGSSIRVDATCVRVPVVVGHAESILVETKQPLSIAEARSLLSAAPGVALVEDEPLPTPRTTAGQHKVFVSRVRASRVLDNGLQLWVVADNLLKGAALNAVQIAERIIAESNSPSAKRASAASDGDTTSPTHRREPKRATSTSKQLISRSKS